MTLDYCHTKCAIGIKASNNFLAENDSVSDAAIDFWYFVEECYKTCPYKEINKEVKEEDVQ